MISVDRVSKSYDGNLVVDDVTLTLKKGGLTSIIGPNGAGKSTLLSIVSRLVTNDRGRVLVDGLDVARTDSAVLAKRLSILRQDNHMTARLKVSDLVAFGRYPHSKGRPTVVDREHVERSLGYLGLCDLRNRFLDELSGGQRQRAFIAMVLCQDSDYMLFDEPLNNLDIRHAVDMMRLLRDAAREFGKTVIVVLHDINFASSYSDQIVIMRNGRVFIQGSPSDVIREDVLSQVYETDVQVRMVAGKPIAIYY